MLTVLVHFPDTRLAAASLEPGGPSLARLAWSKAREAFPGASLHLAPVGAGLGPASVLAAWAEILAVPPSSGVLVILSAAYPFWTADGVRRVWEAALGGTRRIRPASTAAPVADHPYLLHQERPGIGPRPCVEGDDVPRGHRQDYPALVEAVAATTVLPGADALRWDDALAAGRVQGVLLEGPAALAVRDEASLAWARQLVRERRLQGRPA